MTRKTYSATLIDLATREIVTAFVTSCKTQYNQILNDCKIGFKYVDGYYSDPDIWAVKVDDGWEIQAKPANQLRIDAGAIKEARAVAEQRPVAVQWHKQELMLDVDDESLRRLEDAVWVCRELETIVWIDARNSPVTIEGVELIQLLDSAKKARARRSLAIHQYSQALKARLPHVTKADIEAQNWPL